MTPLVCALAMVIGIVIVAHCCLVWAHARMRNR